MGPVFRHDRPQLGRYRQFTQIGFETIGGQNDPVYDAEIISIASDFLMALKIKNASLNVNSVGCRICRPIYKKQLQNYYRNHETELCPDCVRRLKTNPLRLLDCKEPACVTLKEKAPNFLDKLCVVCSGHFKIVLEYLDEAKISYALDNTLVRGLDYYSRTVFEIVADGPEAGLGSLVGGGRYDYLMEMIGGHMTPALGFASGVERLIAVMKARGIEFPAHNGHKIFLAHAGELAKKKAFALVRKLRSDGLKVVEALAKESLSAQLKAADKENIGLALILGQKEIYEESVILRDLKSGAQEAVPLSRIVAEVKKRL
jgi:histidyl-tRNA synthetase